MILRRWYRILAGVFLLLLLDETALPVRAAASVTQTAGDQEECTLSHACQVCTSSDQKEISECLPAGRRESFICLIYDGDGNEIGTRTKFESCKRTAADDEFLLVRFQVFCILLGAFAVVSVRKQKRLSATLFDQRKLQAEQERKERERERESVHGIELGSMEETVPLTSNVSNPSMEVV